ncbi:MAG: spore coat protein U domain-containing protein [Gallionella sp.]
MKFKPGKVRGASVFTDGSFPVAIVAPATCVNTAPPANLAFNYTAFSATPVLASTSFGVRCTTSLVYTISLDATDDVVAGLNYTLGLNTVGTGGGNPLATVGTGVPQTFFINGSMAAGQAGACNTSAAPCSAAQIRTLTVTY